MVKIEGTGLLYDNCDYVYSKFLTEESCARAYQCRIKELEEEIALFTRHIVFRNQFSAEDILRKLEKNIKL
jgi:hypothetical protein